MPVPRAGIYLQACLDARGGLQRASCWSGGGCSTPALSRPSRRSLGTAWQSRSNSSRTMPCGGSYGPRPWPIAGRRGEGPARSAYREVVGYFEQGLGGVTAPPRDARHARTGRRPPVDSAQSLILLGEFGRMLTYLMLPRPWLRFWTITAGPGGWSLYSAISLVTGDYDRYSNSGQRALP